MIESEDQTYIEWIAREARRPVVTDPAARVRIMDAVRAAPAPTRRVPFWSRLFEPHLVNASPIAGFALAAGLVGIGVFGGSLLSNRDGRPPVGSSPMVPPRNVGVPVSDTVIKFVFFAPQASKVSVVGDFNGWSVDRT